MGQAETGGMVTTDIGDKNTGIAVSDEGFGGIIVSIGIGGK
eukprot:CAMPEP_0172422872 /NCGR_PEP_ID=MMETSP1064-20121228/8993_1 /TAXON_ID=202472 /ORGANISM="Aulacoseira subarctica , Strain CCAP 1002/5" /LENGTH=40 /DNA_ID= /DNA_START= /DNA_END= /DNA_ORIENTATION=